MVFHGEGFLSSHAGAKKYYRGDMKLSLPLLFLTACASYAQLNQVPSRPTLPLDLPRLPERAGTVVTTGALGHPALDGSLLPNPPVFPASVVPSFVGTVSYLSPRRDITVAIKPEGRVIWWGDPWQEAATVGFNRGIAAVIGITNGEKELDPTIFPLSADDGDLWDPPALDWLSSLPRSTVQLAHPAAALETNGSVSQVTPQTSYRPSVLERILPEVQSTPKPANLSDIVQIESGLGFTAALKRDGTVAVWGFFLVPSNAPNRVGIPGFPDLFYKKAEDVMRDAFPNGLSNVVQISGPRDYRHLLALRRDGTVTGLGYAVTGFETAPEGWTTYQWTPATNSIPASLTDVVRVQAGNYFNVAIRSNGRLVAWPTNQQNLAGMLVPSSAFINAIANASNVVDVAVGNQHAAWLSTAGRVSSEHILSGYAGFPAYPQTNTAAWSNVIDIAAGQVRTYGIVLPTNELAIRSSGSSLLALDSTSYTFPTAVLGVSQKTQSFTVQNTGASPITFGASLEGQSLQEFQIVGLVGNITLQSGASTNVQVRFAPVSVGTNKVAQLKMAGGLTESVIELRGDAVSAQTNTNGISPALRHIFRDFNVDLDQPTNGLQFLSSLGLYTPQSIMDLSFGARMLQRTGSNAIVELRLQTSDDLAKTPFSDHQRVTNTIPMPGNKGFLRVRADNN
jgi:hypothetical protein